MNSFTNIQLENRIIYTRKGREILTELFLEKDIIILEISKLGKEINEFEEK